MGQTAKKESYRVFRTFGDTAFVEGIEMAIFANPSRRISAINIA
jgi:hypothetical protein